MTINDINSFLSSSEFTEFLVPFKAIFLLLSLIMVCLGLYYLVQQKELLKETRRKIDNFFSQQHFSVHVDFASQWKEIKALLPKEDQITYRLIVTRMSNLFFDILEKSNLSDKTLEELDERRIPNLREVKEIVEMAEKLRDDSSLPVDIDKVKELAASFEKTMAYLKLL
ncbi:MAG: hypothetical protein WC410_02320 [Candidatus Paceibacterota bacterium]|nr:hypothetical protein [Candidatus Paceibacterota bacterium]MDD5555226.1 hypothetical protein [Candidatus Paceibacterota bacterium]